MIGRDVQICGRQPSGRLPYAQGRRHRGGGGGKVGTRTQHFWNPGDTFLRIREWSGLNPASFPILGYFGGRWPHCRRFVPHSKIRGDAPAYASPAARALFLDAFGVWFWLTPPHTSVFHVLRFVPSRCVHAYTWTYNHMHDACCLPCKMVSPRALSHQCSRAPVSGLTSRATRSGLTVPITHTITQDGGPGHAPKADHGGPTRDRPANHVADQIQNKVFGWRDVQDAS